MNEDQFLDNEEVQDVAHANIEKIVSLEEREARRILKVFKSVRQDLRDRLDSFPAGEFSAQRTRAVLIQVESALNAIKGNLKSEMDSSAQEAAETGVDDLISELNKYNKYFKGAVVPINLDALVVATDTKNFLFNQYETSMESYTQIIRSKFARGISQAAVEQISMSELVSRISKTMMDDEFYAHRLVRTELHNIYSLGKLNSMKDLWNKGDGDIPDLKKALFHSMDSRTGKDSIYAEKLELIVPVDEPFRYKWQGKERVFMAPPDRPNDRSILIPYRTSWKS